MKPKNAKNPFIDFISKATDITYVSPNYKGNKNANPKNIMKTAKNSRYYKRPNTI